MKYSIGNTFLVKSVATLLVCLCCCVLHGFVSCWWAINIIKEKRIEALASYRRLLDLLVVRLFGVLDILKMK